MRSPSTRLPIVHGSTTVTVNGRVCEVSRLVVAHADVQIDGESYRVSGMWRSSTEDGTLVFTPVLREAHVNHGTANERELGPCLTLAVHAIGYVREALREAALFAVGDWSNEELLFACFPGHAPVMLSGEFMEEDRDAGLLGDSAVVTAVNGVELPSCPYSPSVRPETARVLAEEAGVSSELDHETLTEAWSAGWHAQVGRVRGTAHEMTLIV